MRRIVGVLAAMALVLGFTSPTRAAEPDIVERLQAISGMKVLQEFAAPGYRNLLVSYVQPVDHRKPQGATFEQRFYMMHKAEDRPMVLHTTGYNLYIPSNYRSEPMILVDGNQISVEQRFFEPSRPQPADWSKLDVWQAASDHHRLVTALKGIYKTKWISTGASKGGMTSVYHARFYPKDMDGVVSYVAPNDVINKEDSRYDKFMATVGNDPVCRENLRNLAIEALKRREPMEARIAAAAEANGFTFDLVGDIDIAFENSMMDFEWVFWQYGLQADCADVPPTTVSDDALYAYLDGIVGMTGYADQVIEQFVPYYYQAGTQLGWPAPKFKHLDGLLRHEETYVPRTYVPDEIPMKFNPFAMADIDLWVKFRGEHLMFLYGGNDPWGAEPFKLGPGTKDSFWYEIEGLNHSARLIQRLPDAQKAEATSTLLRWTGQTSVAEAPSVRSVGDTYDELLDGRPPM